MIELTRLTKHGGPLTKRIFLTPDGTLVKDGSACVMGRGVAERVRLDGVDALAALIEGLAPSQALALGALRPDLPDNVQITTKKKLLNGVARPDIIARTGADINYNGPAFALLDFDSKGMPTAVAAELARAGGFWAALRTVLPALGAAARVTRRSTGAGLSRADTGEALPGSDGMHVFVLAKDGTDSERFLSILHERCWLSGFGWMIVSSSGALLERSIVDRMVGGPERLVFEGGPVLMPPLQQDKEAAARSPLTGSCSTQRRCALRCRSSSGRGSKSSRTRSESGSHQRQRRRERSSSRHRPKNLSSAPACPRAPPDRRSPGSARACCGRISSCRLMTRNSTAAP
jgi:hypothetical protein